MTALSVDEINQMVAQLHQAHYENSETGLVNPNESPNGNIIYHLYDDGEITQQKGGWSYLSRGEFPVAYPIFYGKKIYQFPISCGNGAHTYAILTQEECASIRRQMAEIKY
jgi:hypothetical protein